MTPELWSQVDAAFGRAIALEAGPRAAFVAQLRAEDARLADTLEGLLAADAADDEALREPISRTMSALADTLDDVWIGRTLGHWKIVSRIATGGMGAVFLAERDDAQFEQRVAIKLMGAHLLDVDARARFRAERQILAAMQHPYIARLLDGGTLDADSPDQGAPYLVMEYVVGVPITQFAAERRLSRSACLRLLQKVCAAVGYAHRNLVVHRDLKPGNILVDDHGDPRLLDFGIAKLVGPVAEDATRTLQRLTPDYASPEQLLGEPVTTVSDVYALGVLLYELLAGQRPFQLAGLRPTEVERLVCETGPARPSLIVRRDPAAAPLSPDLDAIVLKAMHPQPEARYPSVLALSEDIDRFLAGQPVEARRRTFRYAAAKYLRRNRLPVASAALAALVAVGGLLAHGHIVAEQRDVARLQAERAQAVTDFLIDVFQQADPAETEGTEVTARELLDRGAAALDVQLSQQPVIRTALRNTIGEVYGYLGAFDRSEAQFRDAIADGVALDDDAVRADSYEGLGDALLENGAFDEARAAFDQAQALHEQADAPDPAGIARSRLGVARVALADGDFGETETRARAALEGLETAGIVDDPAYAEALGLIGQSLQLNGAVEASEGFVRRALDWNLAHNGERHRTSMTLLHDHASILHELGRFEAAESEYLRAARLELELLGDSDADYDATLTSIGRLYTDMGRLDDAERYLREAVAWVERVRGPTHAYTAYDIVSLANLLHLRGRYDEGLIEVDRALAIYAEALDANHPYVASARLTRAGMLLGLNRPREAAADARRARAIVDETLPAGHWLAASADSVLGEALMQQGRLDEAGPLLTGAVPVLEAARPGDRATRNAQRRLAEYYTRTGNAAAAERYRLAADAR